MMGVNGADRAVLLDQKVEKDIEWISRRGFTGIFHGDDLIHGKTFVGIIGADEHTTPIATDGSVMVVPARALLLSIGREAFTLGWISQTGQETASSSFMSPRRDDTGEIVIAASVGINIRLDINTANTSLVNQADCFAHAAPIFFVGDFEMNDVDRNARAFANEDRLTDRIEHAETFVPHMSGVNPAKIMNDLAEFNEIIGCGE